MIFQAVNPVAENGLSPFKSLLDTYTRMNYDDFVP
jgi:hypothetical protein